jgi:hypothetical protein
MQVGADRLVALADSIDGPVAEVAPNSLGDALAGVRGALGGSDTAAAADALAGSLGEHLRGWCDDLTGWADSARASAAGYDAVDRRTRTRFDQVPL